MAFERESIPDSSSQGIPSLSQQPIMREDREFDPYKYRNGIPRKQLGQNVPKVENSNIGQADTPEKPDLEELKPASAEESVKLSPQMAALARREQKFRQSQEQLEAEKAQIASEREELAQLRAMREKLGKKDYSALDGLVNYDEYSNYQVEKANGVDPVQEELKKLNGKISDFEKNAQENLTKQYEAAVDGRREATRELIDNSTEFPSIKKAAAHEAVVKHILDTWENDSEELSVEQAAKEVEEALREQAKEWAALLEEEKKEAPQVPDAEQKTLPPIKQAIKTLTNEVTSGVPKSPRRSLAGLSDSERWAEARRRAEEKMAKQGG